MKWPTNPARHVFFADLLEPAVKAITESHRLECTGMPRWSGLPLGEWEAASNVDIADPDDQDAFDWLVEKAMERGEEWPELRAILGQLIRTAIEQGRRLEAARPTREHRVCGRIVNGGKGLHR